MPQISTRTPITPKQSGRQRFRYDATANGVSAVLDTSLPISITAEPISVNGRCGIVFRDSHGDPIKYVLRDA